MPAKNWSVIWTLSILVSVGVLGGSEAFWRNRGHRPWLGDTKARWADHLASAHERREKQVVLLGASLMQLGFSTDVSRERFPDYPVTQLAINTGEGAIPVLRDLASDEQFRGIVICSIREEWFSRDKWHVQQKYVEYHHHAYATRWDLDPAIAQFVRSRTVITNPNLRLDNLLRSTLRGNSFPAPPLSYLEIRDDRSILADYTMTDLDERRRKEFLKNAERSMPKGISARQALSDMAEAEEYVRRIQLRGGEVVFLRMPVSQDAWKREQQCYPRGEYWDAMAASSTAVTIHFQDIPAFGDLKFSDLTHLDYRESRRFTAALLDELVDRGILAPGGK